MNIPDMFYNQGNAYQSIDRPYERVYELVASKSSWKVAVDQNGNEMLLLEGGEHAWDCCCSGCIDDDPVTEHLEWIDWYGRNYEWEVTHHRNWRYELVDKLGTGIPRLYPIGVEEE